MGLVENRLQITELIKQVDKNGNFEIDFNEFLAIIKKGNGSDNSLIYDFFKKLTSGKLKETDQEVSFPLIMSSIRRQKILDAMMSKGDKAKT